MFTYDVSDGVLRIYICTEEGKNYTAHFAVRDGLVVERLFSQGEVYQVAYDLDVDELKMCRLGSRPEHDGPVFLVPRKALTKRGAIKRNLPAWF